MLYRRFLESTVTDLKSHNIYRAIAGEMVGVMLLVFVACSSPYWRKDEVDHTKISLAFGLSVATIVWVLGCMSGGHINPAVTTAMLVMRKVSLARFVLYVIFQCIGAILGAALMYGLTCKWQLAELGVCGLGVTKIHPQVTIAQAFGIELLITGVLVLTVFATCDPSKYDHKGSGPLAIGLSVTMCHLGFIKFTGASMNPARSFGPAVILGSFDHHWIYWVGPILGGVMAGAFYEFVLAGDACREKIKQWAVSPDYGLVGAHEEDMDAVSQTSAEPPAGKGHMMKRRSTSQRMVPMIV